MSLILIGTLASFLAALLTVVGALPAFFTRKISEKFMDTCLGLAAGVMLAAVFFGLLSPAIKIGGIWRAAFGIALGALFLICAERFTPHMHWVAGVKGPPTHLGKIWLFVLAMTIHNFPEGLAVGVGFGTGSIKEGVILAIGIGLQNAFEGLAVAFPLLRNKSTRIRAFLVASLTAVVEPIGGFLGISIVSMSRFILPYGLAFAAGAMLFVISEEMIPETHSRGNAREATVGVIIGFIIMMILENLFV